MTARHIPEHLLHARGFGSRVDRYHVTKGEGQWRVSLLGATFAGVLRMLAC